MATSGNQVYGSSVSSSSPPFPDDYDVYCSFRSIDTGTTFVDQLLESLSSEGIRTLSCESDQEGLVFIASIFLPIIEISKVIIVILSENYASSRWCLDELVEILKLKREGKHQVISIFYHVDPRDVRQQTGEFGKAFQKHRDMKNDDKLEPWKAALAEIGKLPGHHVPFSQTQTEYDWALEDLQFEIANMVQLYMLPEPNSTNLKSAYSTEFPFTISSIVKCRPESRQNFNLSGVHFLLCKSEVTLKYSKRHQGILSDNEILLSLIEKVSEDKLLKSKLVSVTNLNVIRLRNSKLPEIPDNLSFPYLKMIILLNIAYIPPSFFEQMPALEVLDISDPSIKTLPPSISKLINLKELLLRRCKLLTDLPHEIGALVNLNVLNISDCKVLKRLPESIIKMRSLQNLYLSGCSSLVQFHGSEFSINSVRTTGQPHEMEVFLGFYKSEYTLLDITELLGLMKKLLEYEFLKSKSVAVRSLKVIHIRNSNPEIQDNVSFPDVEELFLQSYHDSSCIPSSFFELPALKVLDMSTTSIKTLPSWVYKLIKLKTLILRDCELLMEVPDGIGVLENLRLLDLSGCSSLFEVPKSFFEKMPALEVLDMSNTSMKTLPSSFSKLIKLKKLLLRHCELLKELPHKIGTLENLTVMDLEGTDLVCLPEELRKLIKLKCLKVSLYDAESYRTRKKIHAIIPAGTLSQLSELEELSMNIDPHDTWCEAALEAIMKDLPSLRKLETLKLYLPTAKLLQHLLKLEWEKGLSIYQGLSDFNLIVGPHDQRFISPLPCDLEQEFLKLNKCLKYINGKDETTNFAEALKHANALYLDRDWDISKLSIFKLEELEKLKFCLLVDCNQMETVFDGSDFTNELAKREKNLSLQYMAIYNLHTLKEIWKGPDVGVCVHSLKVLALHMCPNLDTVFTPVLLKDLVNLNEIIIEDCPRIKTLMTDADSRKSTSNEILPKLKKLSLLYLPELVSISSGFSIGPELVNIVIYDCPKLKKLPLMGVSCKEGIKIKAESKWWNALEWNEPEWSTGQPNYLRCAFAELGKDGNLLVELEPQDGNSLRLCVEECDAN